MKRSFSGLNRTEEKASSSGELCCFENCQPTIETLTRSIPLSIIGSDRIASQNVQARLAVVVPMGGAKVIFLPTNAAVNVVVGLGT